MFFYTIGLRSFVIYQTKGHSQLTKLNEQQLIWRFNLGDRKALYQIYEQYKEPLTSLACALLTDRSHAEDVVHDVFVRFSKIKQFVLTGRLRSYLCTCVANQARNVNNAQQRHQELNQKHRTPEKMALSPVHEVLADEQQQQILQGLDQLPYEQREVVVLRIHSDLSFKQISKIQGVSINTVQGRYRYGIKRLRDYFHVTKSLKE